MSGIVGIIDFVGPSINTDLLQRLTECLVYRGPDGQSIWTKESIGLGHSLLRIDSESERITQPLSMDGRLWITADARIDNRKDLIQRLKENGCKNLQNLHDVQLILQAYSMWSEKCVEILTGDFCFAIWDDQKRRLFCARDQFGVKPFYYSCRNGILVFSNTLNCIRKYPGLADDLNDQAIADFLLFGTNFEQDTTTFAQINRLPPAHFLIWSAEHSLTIHKYWSLPFKEPIIYKDPVQYIDHFKILFKEAVNDRVRSNKIGIWMSGGTDSTSTAVTAHQVLSERYDEFELSLYTSVYGPVVADQEGYYSDLVANALKVRKYDQDCSDYRLFQNWGEPRQAFPEPLDDPFLASMVDRYKNASPHSRTVLSGLGGDPVLDISQTYFVELVRNFRFFQLINEVGRYFFKRHKLPGLNFRSTIKRKLGIKDPYWHRSVPEWLNSDLKARLCLEDRWQENWVESQEKEREKIHPTHSDACHQLLSPLWANLFEAMDPGVTCFPLEQAHPFFDIRLIDYILRIPPMPWCANKEILREAMRNVLPERVRLRPKAVLKSDPVGTALRKYGLPNIDTLERTPVLSHYVDMKAMKRMLVEIDNFEYNLLLRPLSLAHWLSRTLDGSGDANTT